MMFIARPRVCGETKVYINMIGDVRNLKCEVNSYFSISKEKNLTREKYYESKRKIEEEIFRLFKRIDKIESFSVALFNVRSTIKELMYREGMEKWSIKFKLFNYLFFLCVQYQKDYQNILDMSWSERNIIRELLNVGYTALDNMYVYDTSFFKEEESVEKFYNRINEISDMEGDLHSYKVSNKDLQEYLEEKELTYEKMTERGIKQYKDMYIRKSELEKNISWEKICKDNINNPNDDVIMAPTNVFNKYDKQFQTFIMNFEAEKCKDSLDEEADLIFSYKTKEYIYISKKILHDAQEIIEKFLTWGQYDNLIEYFLEKPSNEKVLRDYNRLMTYKIADLLVQNNYSVPMKKEKKKIVPWIEISKYTQSKEQRNRLGDIDIFFYSEKKILYLIEYKNYQMMVSKEGALSAEISKVKREKTPEKVIKRQKFIENNLEECCKIIFGEKKEVVKVKSIILTTKPCYYFFKNESEDYEYMDWIEFKDKVEGKEF